MLSLAAEAEIKRALLDYACLASQLLAFKLPNLAPLFLFV